MMKKAATALPLYDRRRLLQLVMEHKLRVLQKQHRAPGATGRGKGAL